MVLGCDESSGMVTNLGDLRQGILILNSDNFEAKDLKLAKLDVDPRTDGSLKDYRVIEIPMTTLTRKAVEETGLSVKQADQCKNFFAMGLVYWLFGRDVKPTLRFIEAKFTEAEADLAEANRKALQAGWSYGETTGAFRVDVLSSSGQTRAGNLSQHYG
jgi:2-oxoglutarate ferredoxin oxidoreductase subunit alpha